MNKFFSRSFWMVALLPLIYFLGVNGELVAGDSLTTWMAQSQRTPGNDEPLTPELAFPFHAETMDATTVVADWNITQGYYLYRDKMHFRLIDAPTGVSLGKPNLPHGDSKEDEFLGTVEVYHAPVQVRLPIQRSTLDGGLSLTLEAGFQGCAEGRLCYPPLTRVISLTLPPLVDATATGNANLARPPTVSPSDKVVSRSYSEPDRIVALLAGGNRALVIFWFFGIGLLLAFTPCVFPMIPILSSIIVGQGKDITTARAFSLSLVYVLAMAATYTVAGVVAGLVGTNLQAMFQNPWIIGTFSTIFVTLALSMFGLYELQLPAYFQTHLTVLANHQKGGTFVGVAVMGFLSALIVGPCVAPPLAGVLIYIGRSGDALLGGLTLFSMSMGMGAPLLLIGTTEGRWLPRAGAWMSTVKAIFGVLLLAVALEMLERILPTVATLFLWGTLYIVSGVYLGALERLPEKITGWQQLWKGIGMVLMIQGALVLVGAASGGDDPFQPLRRLSSPAVSAMNSVAGVFQRVDSANFDQALANARGRPVLLDFYADWCVECKRMERTTFSTPEVRAALAELVPLQIDVTRNTSTDQALLRRFELFGPPGLLFFSPDGIERRDARVIGFMSAKQFLTHLEQITAAKK
ncbi:Thiol:disulfide interchange protein DsbD [Gammaproteobacteria bacterium]